MTRANCSASRHGDESAYDNYGCRCPDAREDNRIKEKRRREGRHVSPYVSPVGTSRRLQALAALGHSGVDLASELGCSAQRVDQLRNARLTRVRRETAQRIGDLYERLCGTPGSSQYSRERALAQGWAPPLAWEDDAIDDPTAQPVRDETSPPRGVDLGEVRFLASQGLTLHEIAARFDVEPESILRAEYRAQERLRTAVDRAREAIHAATPQPSVWETQPDTHTRHLQEMAR